MSALSKAPFVPDKSREPFFNSFAAFVLPQAAFGRLAFYLLLAPLLLIVSNTLVQWHPFPGCSLVPLLAFAGLIATLFFRTYGLMVAYGLVALFVLFVFPDIPSPIRLYHMTLLFTVLVSFYITLLGIEESESVVRALVNDVKAKTTEMHKQNAFTKERESAFDKQVKELEEEIEKWKEEAEQRRIEKRVDKERLAFFNEELKAFSCHKQSFVDEARLARGELALLKSRLTETVALLQQKENEVQKERHLREERVQELTAKLEAVLVPMQKTSASPELVQKVAKAEGLYKQLRHQFDEKSALLDATRQELFFTSGRLAVLELEEKERALSSDFSELNHLHQDLSSLVAINELLENQIFSLEELVSSLMSNTNFRV